MSDLADAALDYCRRGWPVLPLHTPTTFGTKTGENRSHYSPFAIRRTGPDRAGCSCGSTDCESQGKHPRTRHGLDDASTEADTVRRWWDRWPGANVGIRTGVAFDGIDVDGTEAEAALGERMVDDETIDGPTVATGVGWHVYVAPTGFRNRTGFVPGVDFRGQDGYVVAPPSVHMSGRRYEWELPDHPVFGPEAPLQPARPWLLALVAPSAAMPSAPAAGLHHNPGRYGQAALEGELGRLLMVPVGQRNDQLNRSAHALGQLVGGAVLEQVVVVDRLLEAAARAGLGAGESERTIASGLRAGMANPRKATA